MKCSSVSWIVLCITTGFISEGVVLSTVLFLFRWFIVLFLLLILLFNEEFGDVFLAEEFVGREMGKGAGSLTAFWIFKSIEVGVYSSLLLSRTLLFWILYNGYY